MVEEDSRTKYLKFLQFGIIALMLCAGGLVYATISSTQECPSCTHYLNYSQLPSNESYRTCYWSYNQTNVSKTEKINETDTYAYIPIVTARFSLEYVSGLTSPPGYRFLYAVNDSGYNQNVTECEFGEISIRK